MRLIRLKLKNIASLKGEHLVDFQDIQNKGPLFAITGETGAGKSSLLNAIGLALYGQIYKKNVNQVDIVTLGEKEAEIKLIIQVASKYYLAEWRAKVRKANGELLKNSLTTREVYPIDGADFDSIKGEPIASVDALLNLNFDQFCKCIILNQGEFARFLNSSFTERKEILEKLYPGELLDQLGKTLKTELDALEDEKTLIEVKLADFEGGLLDGKELVKEKARLTALSSEQESWLKRLTSYDIKLQVLVASSKKHLENQRKLEGLALEVTEGSKSYDLHLKEVERLNLSHQAILLKQAKELPRLQEALKWEESLRLGLERKNVIQLKLAKLKTEIEASKIAQAHSVEHLSQWSEKHQALKAKFKFSATELITHSTLIDEVIELFQNKTNLLKENAQILERLKELETTGAKMNQELSGLTETRIQFPPDIDKAILALEKRKDEGQKLIHENQKAQIKLAEFKLQETKLEEELKAQATKLLNLNQLLTQEEQEHRALEATLKLLELRVAVKTCLTHLGPTNEKQCPVCETQLTSPHWGTLLANFEQIDNEATEQRVQEIARLIIRHSEEKKHTLELKTSAEGGLKDLQLQISGLTETVKQPLQSITDLEEELKSLQKKSWDLAQLAKEEARIKADLHQTRELYREVKNKGQKIHDELQACEALLQSKLLPMKNFISSEINTHLIQLLKEEKRLLSQFTESETTGEKLRQEERFIQEKEARLLQDQAHIETELLPLDESLQDLKEKLQSQLQGGSAIKLMETLREEVQNISQLYSKAQENLNLQGLKLKNFKDRITELKIENENTAQSFRQHHQSLKEESAATLSPLSEDLKTFESLLTELPGDLASEAALTLTRDHLTTLRETLKNDHHQLIREKALIDGRITEYEKRQQKITALMETKKIIEAKHARMERLFGILGKDELRSFVLSLVEESLITQTNDELQRLCQGRYEIVHQSKGMKVHDFYILDKFRDGEQRKVSTLSGGETFMVSIAMALALAEMTRGQAQIDSLFIDEGFGTLDHDSLEDVVDMLQQIQNRGLMVGIISHIKALTNSLPVNLVLKKGQDGTSTMGLSLN